jgi:hypothetical protein
MTTQHLRDYWRSSIIRPSDTATPADTTPDQPLSHGPTSPHEPPQPSSIRDPLATRPSSNFHNLTVQNPSQPIPFFVARRT